jgi:hypothetical protein
MDQIHKSCYGNYISKLCYQNGGFETKICDGCFIKTNIEKGPCDCKFKQRCNIIRQMCQYKYRKDGLSNEIIEDCPFYLELIEKEADINE